MLGPDLCINIITKNFLIVNNTWVLKNMEVLRDRVLLNLLQEQLWEEPWCQGLDVYLHAEVNIFSCQRNVSVGHLENVELYMLLFCQELILLVKNVCIKRSKGVQECVIVVVWHVLH